MIMIGISMKIERKIISLLLGFITGIIGLGVFIIIDNILGFLLLIIIFLLGYILNQKIK